jgi:GT2 family glycosyltransferase
VVVPAPADRFGPPTVSVVIVTWLRPEYVRDCLEHLAALRPSPNQIIVIDASADARTAEVVAGHAGVERIAFHEGAGHMTTARNAGLRYADGEIIAFLDDDANARVGWLEGLLEAFSDPFVGAVAGRTCNGVPGEDASGVGEIGLIRPDGELTGNFAADPGRVVEVHHGIGANMAFRRSVLADLGGFRDDFPGAALREDADAFLRVRALGWRTVFAPSAIVDHVGAPHVRGHRFDYRYQFWARCNHALLLGRNFGIGSMQFRGWITSELRPDVGTGSAFRRAVRVALAYVGIGAGVIVGAIKGGWHGRAPERRDDVGEQIRHELRT